MASQKPRKRKSPSSQTARVVSVGTPVRLEKPASGRKPKAKASDVAIVVAQEINPIEGFVGFIKEYGVVSLAVGFAVATQVQGVIKQLIASFIDPLYALLFGQKLSAKVVTFHFHGRSQGFAWGSLVYSVIDLIMVLAVIYIVVKVFNLDKLQKPVDTVKK